MPDDGLIGQIDMLLAPLSEVRPAQRSSGRSIARRDRLTALALLLIVLVVATAATWTTVELTDTPQASPVSPGQPLACLGLVGGSAEHAQGMLSARDLIIHWRPGCVQPDRRKERDDNRGSLCSFRCDR